MPTDHDIQEVLLKIASVSKLLGVCEETVRRWTNSGQLPSQRTLGGHRRFKYSDIEDVIAQTRTKVENDLKALLDNPKKLKKFLKEPKKGK